MAEWHAEVSVDEPLVRRLLGQFPTLALDSIRLIGEGWDNAVWLVDEEWAFRFPRRRIAIPGVEREIALLPRLGPLLPVAVPVPEHVGRPAENYPWPFFGARVLPGRETAHAALDDEGRAAVGVQVAAFLRRLHAVQLDDELPVDPNGRADMPRRVARTREQLAELERLEIWRPRTSLAELLVAAERLPSSTSRAVVHGDLHFRHVLIGDGGEVTGVIDWGDVCRADPAIDLPLYWSLLAPGGRVAFLDAYGPVARDQLLRARVLALSLCAALAAYGRLEGHESVEREALAGLERTLLD